MIKFGIFELNPEESILFMNLNRFTCDSTKVSFFRYLILIFHLNWGNIFLSKLKRGVHCHNCNIVVKLILMILFMYFEISNLIPSKNFEITNSEFDTTFLLMNKGTKAGVFYNVKNGWSFIASKSSSENLSNHNKHLCFCTVFF